MTGLNLRPVQWVPRIIAEIRDNGEPDLMRTHTMTTLYRKDLGAPEDFTESRSIVCMIDRVCCVMYRCNYELLISPYNLFHPTTKTHYNPGVCSGYGLQSQTVVCVWVIERTRET